MSGTEGKITFTAKSGSVELHMACPYSGENIFAVTKNEIPGVTATVTYFSGASGHPTEGTLKFSNSNN